MKDYLSRLKNGGKTYTFILRWCLRVLILGAFVANCLKDTATLTAQIHIALCFVGTFLWEFSLAMPKGSLFRLIPSSIHTAADVGLFVSAFFGVYLNLYYDMRYFDPLMQALFGAWAVLYGYEVACAMVKRDKISATKAMVFYAAFGISFILFTATELGEFACDQIIGKITGEPGNSQFWSIILAQGTQRAETVIPPINPSRAPLMDIMNDIIMHSVGSFCALIFINIYPYRLRGRFKYDMEYGNNTVKTKENVNS